MFSGQKLCLDRNAASNIEIEVNKAIRVYFHRKEHYQHESKGTSSRNNQSGI